MPTVVLCISMVSGPLEQHERFGALARAEGDAVVGVFERVFDLRAFTGRSGTMYGYEGLGSKLLLAIQEVHATALESGAGLAIVRELARSYYRVRDGLGFNKSAEVFGAFPSDPYSHTVGWASGKDEHFEGTALEQRASRAILGRTGEVRELVVSLLPSDLIDVETA